MDTGDLELLRQYASRQCEDSFGVVVSRHLDLVYSVALRQVGNRHQAEEIAQAVFLTLAQKAGSLSPKTVLSGWLYQTTRLTAANFIRSEMRRMRREQQAFMDSLETGESVWREISPLLDDAMGRLNTADRDAVVLRFMEGRNLREVGSRLGITEEAAKKRVARAVEKLRGIMQEQGAAVSGEALGSAMATQAVQAAPLHLAPLILGQVVHASTVTASTITLMKSTLKTLAWAKLKTGIAVTLLAGAGAIGILTVTAAFTAEQKEPSKNSKETAAVPAPEVSRKVLVFRNQPSWNRARDFEEVLTELDFKYDVKPSSEMATVNLAPYATVVIPGSQNSEYYSDYVANASRIDRWVAGGGSLVLELNGAEDNSIALPAGVTMTKHGAVDNLITVPEHPILASFSGKRIHANFASHGYLEGLPQGALTLATEMSGEQAALDRPTFAEYSYAKGRVIAACQCFHDRDKSRRGILMPSLLSYAAERDWYSVKK